MSTVSLNARKQRFALALATALGLHLALLLLRLPQRPAPSPPSEAIVDAPELDVSEIAPNPMPKSDVPGGGSTKPGSDTQARATPKEQRAPPKVKAVPRPEPVRPPPPRHDAQEAKEPKAVTDVETLMAEEFDTPDTFSMPTLRAARTKIAASLHRSEEAPATGKDKTDANSIDRGTGPGRGSGPGGLGHGRFVQEKFDFGGPDGAFQADVCALPKMTPSLAAIGEGCPHLLSFRTDRINVSERPFRTGFPGLPDRVEWFGIKYTGPFRVKKSGVYSFRLVSDDGSILWVDDQLVINNDGMHAPLSRYGEVHLEAGLHQLKLMYFQGPGVLLALQLFVTPPGRHEKTFRPEF